AILKVLSLSARISMTRAWLNEGSPRRRKNPARRKPFLRLCLIRIVMLLRHVAEDEPRVLVGEGGPHAHMADHGRHQARRKLTRRSMAPAAVGAKPQLSLQTRVLDRAVIRTRLCSRWGVFAGTGLRSR